MKILVTAGNTQTPIDHVRCITNIFTGRTGGGIALEAARRGHAVVLLTSHPEGVAPTPSGGPLHIRTYRTFDDLERLMEQEIAGGTFDAVVHVAAVGDYRIAGVYGLADGTRFDPQTGTWSGADAEPRMSDASRGKVKSNHPELWLRMVPTAKLVDRIRRDWGFRGLLVKFKLEVEVGDAELQRIAEESRRQSQADFIVANTLEGMHAWAILKGASDSFTRIPREALAGEILDRLAAASAYGPGSSG